MIISGAPLGTVLAGDLPNCSWKSEGKNVDIGRHLDSISAVRLQYRVFGHREVAVDAKIRLDKSDSVIHVPKSVQNTSDA
jgi:hypothetical protein